MRSQVFATCRLCARDRRPDLGLQLLPGMSMEALRVCETHRSRAQLANGAWLAPLLAESRLVLDGPGLPFLFNPVRIDGVTAWVSWVGASWHVHLPLMACVDAFEYEVLHRAEHQETLWLLHEARASFGANPTAIDLARWARPAGWHRFQAVQHLCDLWWRRRRYGAALRDAGLPCARSAAEAVAISRTLEPCVTPIDRIGEAVRCLLWLAELQFGVAEEPTGGSEPGHARDSFTS